MNLRPAALCGTLLSLWCSAAAQPADTASSGNLRFLPGIPLFPRLTASAEEPRTGIMKSFRTSRIKLDIGAAHDILAWHPWNERAKSLRFGAEFFAYALIMNANGLRLQADAADAFLGGHIIFTDWDDARLLALRLRILHLSAHFLDGHVGRGGEQWRDGRSPIPFSRDYGELTHLWRRSTGRGHYQLYGGVAYATLIRPTDINRWSFLAGGEYVDSSLTGNLLGQSAHLYAALHYTLAGVPAWTGTAHLEAGVRLGAWDRAGVRVYLSYQTGLEVFHQYYDVREESWGGGIAFDLW